MSKKVTESKKYDIELKTLNNNTSYGKILSQIRPGSYVLECGCATGYMTRWMKENLDCHVSVIEIDEECYEQAQSFADDGYCGDLMENGWEEYYTEKSFDYILFADVLEHLTDPLSVMRRTVKYLKDEGKIIVSVPNIAHNDVILKLIDDRFDYTKLGLLDNTHVHFWGQKNLDKFFEESGLQITLLDGTIIPMGKTEQFADESVLISRNILSDLSLRPLGNIYQYIVTAEKKINLFDKKNCYVNLLPQCENNSEYNVKPISVWSTLFYSETKSFSEENSRVFIHVCLERVMQKIKLSLRLPGNYSQLRIDPCEGYFCQLQSISIICGKEKLLVDDTTGFCIENNYFFTDKDPQLFVDLPRSETENELEISFFLRLFEPEEEALLKEIQYLDRIQSDMQQLKRRIENIEQEYNRINNSFFWKLTKPLRKVLDKTKRIVSKIENIYYS